MDIDALATRLAADGMGASYHPSDAEVDLDRILIGVVVEGFAEPLWLQVSKVAGDHLDGIELFQFFCPLPAPVPPAALDAFGRVVARLNGELPLGAFAYEEFEQVAFFRHIAAAPADQPEGTVLVQTAWLVTFALDMFALEVARAAGAHPQAGEGPTA